jgi:hypothetical protein
VELVCKKKSKYLLIFKDFQAMVENYLVKKIKCIQKDNGDEFFFKAFKGYCKAKHIQEQFTTSYSL